MQYLKFINAALVFSFAMIGYNQVTTDLNVSTPTGLIGLILMCSVCCSVGWTYIKNPH